MLVNKHELEEQFKTDYNSLNAEQKQAVDRIEGPVLVVAGPGTGKTKILSMRIANILLRTDSNASNILCLTFTNDAAANMKNRLFNIIGNEAFKVSIHTFHSFCNSIITENANYFDNDDFEIISALEEKKLYHHLIENLPRKHVLKVDRGNLYRSAAYLSQVFDFVQKENIDLSSVHEICQAYIKDLPNQEIYQYQRSLKTGKKKGDPKQKEIDEEIKSVERFLSAVDLFPTYKASLIDIRRYTFNDMIEKILTCFQEDNFILARYQERFHYVLVDEFQDTNGAQNNIIKKLMGFWEQNNLFVVGDEDQCIFRFQGANVANVTDFYNSHQKNLTTVTLTKNYRSSQAILDVAMNCIQENQGRLSNEVSGLDEKKIIAYGTWKALTKKPFVYCYENAMQEMVGIIEEIKHATKNGFDYNDIAILYSTNKTGMLMASMLKSQHIPFQISKTTNILDAPLVKKIITIFRYLNTEWRVPFDSNEYLFEILHYDFFSNQAFDLADAIINMKSAEQPVHRYSLRYYINTNVKEKFDGIEALENLIALQASVSVADLFVAICTQCKIFEWIMKQEDKVYFMELIETFHHHLLLESKKKHTFTLHYLLEEILDVYIQEGISIPITQNITTQKGVILKTCHAAKGEEYPLVFMMNCVKGEWEKQRNRNTLKIPRTLIGTDSNTNNENEFLEERRRLFYVGITRAEKKLILSYSSDNGDKEASQFILEASKGLDENCITYERKNIPTHILLSYKLESFMPEQKLEIDLKQWISKEKIEQVLSTLNLSASVLDAYLKCPIGFYFTHILKVPTTQNNAIVFGNVLHKVLEYAYQQMQNNQNQDFPLVDECVAYYNDVLQKQKYLSTPYEYETNQEYGKRLIEKLHKEYLINSHQTVLIENKFREQIKDDLYLSGRIDKIELIDTQSVIVDYKTGKFKSEDWKEPNEKNPHGGKHWRQAILYTLLLDRQNKYAIQNEGIEFVYFVYDKNHPDKSFDTYRIAPNKMDKEFMIHLLTETWTRMKNHEFNTGCNDCSWCNLVKEKVNL